MKTIKFIAMLFIATLVFVSCQNEDTLDKEAVSKEKYPEIAAKLQKMHFSTDELEMVETTNIDGTVEKAFQIEGDIIMTREQIMNMQMGGDITTKQYRTYNLVRTPWWGGKRTIRVMGYYGSGTNATYRLSYREAWGLYYAVLNYNALNLKIKFSLFWGASGSRNIIAYHNPSLGVGSGRAGFPTAGNPYWRVMTNTNTKSYVYNRHVMMHELGHTIGMRHTDWFNRCGGGSSEGTGSIGAVHIPGTPWGLNMSSVFTGGCGSSSIITGQFNYYDKVALNYLY